MNLKNSSFISEISNVLIIFVIIIEGGEDLQNWSFSELKLAVQEFVDFQLAQQMQNDEEGNTENPSRLLF